jgi:hypothetical protein
MHLDACARRGALAVAEQLAELGALAVAEAGEGFGGGDAAVRECAVGLGGADSGYDQQQFAYLRAGRVGWRVCQDLCQFELAAREFSLQVGAGAADLVGLGECALPLFG